MGHETLDLTSSSNNTLSPRHVQKSDLKKFIIMEAFLIIWELDYSLLNLVITFEQKFV